MPRSSLFALTRKILRQSIARHHAATGEHEGITRRQFVALSAAAVSGAMLAMPKLALALATPRIAVIGAGVAGLTATYRLTRAGISPSVFEASNRFGGRMFTQYNFNADGQFCELGGELVDSNHDELIGLCKELGLGLQNLRTGDKGQDLFYFGGRWYSESDLIGKDDATGAFRAIAASIAADQQGLEDEQGYTEKAIRLDAMSLKNYLEPLRDGTPAWAMDLLEVAYTCEYGAPISEQSALNLVSIIGTDTAKGFQIYGDSDESWRIAGGSSRLTEALVKAIGDKATFKKNTRLVALQREGPDIACSFDNAGTRFRQTFDRVILALPFTLLRTVEGLDALGLSTDKWQAIRELGYGTNAKIMTGTSSRPWRDSGQYPIPSNGAFFTDLALQSLWESSRAQAGTRGILTNFLGGDAGLQRDAVTRITALPSQLQSLISGMAEALRDEPTSSMFWESYPWTKGSYSSPKPGQVTGFMRHCATPELNGTLFFAGEHTSAKSQGYMNGGVESGNRAAREALS